MVNPLNGNAAAATMSDESLKGLIFGVGNPLLDIIAEVPLEFLKQYGMDPNGAMLGKEQQAPLCNDIVEKFSSKVEYVPGGSCLKSLRACQWMLQKPGVAVFSGGIGNDEFGRILRERAEKAGVDTHFLTTNDYPTGTCAVLLTDNGHNRSLCAFLNASEHFDIKHLQDDDLSKKYLAQQSRFFYITGYFLIHAIEPALHIARASMQQPNRLTLFNLSAPYIPEFYYDNIMKLLPFVDVVFGNDSEFKSFAKMGKFDDVEDLEEIAKKTAALQYDNKRTNQQKRTVIITNAAEPTIVYQNGKMLKFAVPKVAKVIDTNGAGDAFVGGFLSQLVHGGDIEQCIAGAHYAAGVVIQQMGVLFPGQPQFAYHQGSGTTNDEEKEEN